MTKKSRQTDQVEYVVLINLEWPKVQPPQQIGEGYVDQYTAGKELVRLLNKHFPGQWEPENIGSENIRFVHVDNRGGGYILGYVDDQPAKHIVLQQRRDSAVWDIAYHRKALAAALIHLEAIDSQIAALKASAGADGS